MKRIASLAVAAALGAAFTGVFVWAYYEKVLPNTTQVVPSQSAVGKEGNLGKYFYRYRDEEGGSNQLAQFEPSLPPDDTIVLDVFKSLIRDVYGIDATDGALPGVETRDDINYIVLHVNGGSVVFEVFRNSKGAVGTARFWREETR